MSREETTGDRRRTNTGGLKINRPEHTYIVPTGPGLVTADGQRTALWEAGFSARRYENVKLLCLLLMCCYVFTSRTGLPPDETN